MVTLGLKNCGLEDISGVSLKQAQKFYYFIEYCKICRNCSYRLRLERPTVERPTEIDQIMLWLTLISIFYWKTLFFGTRPLTLYYNSLKKPSLLKPSDCSLYTCCQTNPKLLINCKQMRNTLPPGFKLQSLGPESRFTNHNQWAMSLRLSNAKHCEINGLSSRIGEAKWERQNVNSKFWAAKFLNSKNGYLKKWY